MAEVQSFDEKLDDLIAKGKCIEALQLIEVAPEQHRRPMHGDGNGSGDGNGGGGGLNWKVIGTGVGVVVGLACAFAPATGGLSLGALALA